MEQALKTTDGLCTPDVIKSALDHKSEGSRISETTIDSLFGVPDKILIPERYIPDTVSTKNNNNECIWSLRKVSKSLDRVKECLICEKNQPTTLFILCLKSLHST